MLELILAVCLGALEWRVITGVRNVGAPWNGYGAIPGVLDRNNPAPMRYRVLVPWLVGLVPNRHGWRITAYQAIKVALIWWALLAANILVGPLGILWLAVLIAATFRYDYWDCYAELLGVALCLTGDPWAAGIGALVWGLSRETVPLAAPLAYFTGGPQTIRGIVANFATAPGVIAWVLMHRYQGKADFYAERWAMRPYNIPDLRASWQRKEFDPWFSVLWTIAVLAVILLAPLPPALDATRYFAGAWLAAGWLMGRARETRVFLPTALWLAGALAQVVGG